MLKKKCFEAEILYPVKLSPKCNDEIKIKDLWSYKNLPDKDFERTLEKHTITE